MELAKVYPDIIVNKKHTLNPKTGKLHDDMNKRVPFSKNSHSGIITKEHTNYSINELHKLKKRVLGDSKVKSVSDIQPLVPKKAIQGNLTTDPLKTWDWSGATTFDLPKGQLPHSWTGMNALGVEYGITNATSLVDCATKSIANIGSDGAYVFSAYSSIQNAFQIWDGNGKKIDLGDYIAGNCIMCLMDPNSIPMQEINSLSFSDANREFGTVEARLTVTASEKYVVPVPPSQKILMVPVFLIMISILLVVLNR